MDWSRDHRDQEGHIRSTAESYRIEVLIRVLAADGCRDLIPQVEASWQRFDSSIDPLPFTYGKVEFDESPAQAVGWAAASLPTPGQTAVGQILIPRKFFDLSHDEQDLTLLHESLHLASFIGELRLMYKATSEIGHPLALAEMYSKDAVEQRGGIALALAGHLYEVEAEFSLQDRYPGRAANARALYYLGQCQDSLAKKSWDKTLSSARPFVILLYRLRHELAGLLMENAEVGTVLNQSVPRLSDDGSTNPIYELLSPEAGDDFASLQEWGTAAYKEVIETVLAPAQP